jgi:hypothetical protein
LRGGDEEPALGPVERARHRHRLGLAGGRHAQVGAAPRRGRGRDG